MKRRLSGNASSTPRIEQTTIQIIMLCAAITVPVTSMKAARLEIIGDTM